MYFLFQNDAKLASNPFARRGVYKEEPKGQYIPDDEFRRIHQYLPEYVKPVFWVAYLTGMRRGEILELQWWRVNLEEGYLDLTPTDTKTNQPRRIYFNAVKELKDAFIEASKSRTSGQNIVFKKPDGSPIPKWYIQCLFKKACSEASVKPYRLHDLRYSFNTNMIKAGVNKTTIMKVI